MMSATYCALGLRVEREALCHGGRGVLEKNMLVLLEPHVRGESAKRYAEA